MRLRAAWFGKISPHLGTDGLRWAPRSSKPLRGVQNVLDVFDSHTFPPYATSAFVLAVLLRAAKALFCFRRLSSARPLTTKTTTKVPVPNVVVLVHVDETASKHGFCMSGTQKRFYLHRNQNETSARRLMRNFAATVRYYPYSIKLTAHGAPRTTPFFSINWRKHELHAESSRRAQGPLSRAA